MRKNFTALAAAALALGAGSAFAADLPSRRAPAYLPPPPPPPLWTGFYVGLNAGGVFGGDDSATVAGSPFFLAPIPAFTTGLGPLPGAAAATASAGLGGVQSLNPGGFIGGGQIGYNYQFSPAFLAGLEADIQGVTGGATGASSNALGLNPSLTWGAGNTLATSVSVSKSLNYLGTVRGRLGYLVTPTLLAFVSGGLAYGGVSSSASILQNISGPVDGVFFPGQGGIAGAYFTSSAFSDTRVGWTVGAGAEWMFLPNWSAKIEYLYYDLGQINFGAGALAAPITGPGGYFPGAAAGGFPPGVFYALGTNVSERFNGHIVRAGLNYHFNLGAPAPVVAKY